MLLMAGMASDTSGNSRSGGKGTCMAARAKHQAMKEGREGQGGGSMVCKGIDNAHLTLLSGVYQHEK